MTRLLLGVDDRDRVVVVPRDRHVGAPLAGDHHVRLNGHFDVGFDGHGVSVDDRDAAVAVVGRDDRRAVGADGEVSDRAALDVNGAENDEVRLDGRGLGHVRGDSVLMHDGICPVHQCLCRLWLRPAVKYVLPR